MAKIYYLVIDDYIIDFEFENLYERTRSYSFVFTPKQKVNLIKKLFDIMVLELPTMEDMLINSNLEFLEKIINNTERFDKKHVFFTLEEAKAGLKNLKIKEIIE